MVAICDTNMNEMGGQKKGYKLKGQKENEIYLTKNV